MKIIDVKDQVSLSFAKCVELVLSGIKYRLFRAAITVTIIALAVAFLMTMLTESFVAGRVAKEINQRTAPRKTFDFWVSRISAPLTEQDLTKELSKSAEGDPRWKELAAWGKLDDSQLAALGDVAGRQMLYQRYFADLGEGKLRPLFGRARGEEIFRALQDQQAYDRFEEEFRVLGLKMDTSLEDLKALLADWKEAKPHRQAIIDGNRKALAKVGQEPKIVLAAADDSLRELLNANDFQLASEDLQQIRYQASLNVDAERMLRLLKIGRVKNRLADRRGAELADIDAPMYFSEISSSRGAAWLRDLVTELSETIRRLEKDLPTQRAEVAKLQAKAAAMEDQILKLQAKATEQKKALEKVKAEVGDQPDAAGKDALAQAQEADDLAAGQLKEAEDNYDLFKEGQRASEGKPKIVGLADLQQKLKRDTEAARSLMPVRAGIDSFDPTPERIKLVAASRTEQRKLAEIEATVSQAAGAEAVFLGYSSRTMWLIAVSFMVCVVGIANAMLMSVTDRFREIATMKCLGATDAYIMINFILESCLQGTAGGIIGALLGFLLGTLRSLASYGWMAMQHLPWELTAITAVVAVVVGVILSALAAVYPAWIAARLAPMEAMRIE